MIVFLSNIFCLPCGNDSRMSLSGLHKALRTGRDCLTTWGLELNVLGNVSSARLIALQLAFGTMIASSTSFTVRTAINE